MTRKILFNLFASLVLLSNTQATSPIEVDLQESVKKLTLGTSFSPQDLYEKFLAHNHKTPVTLCFKDIGGRFSGSVTVPRLGYPYSNAWSFEVAGVQVKLYCLSGIYYFRSAEDKNNILKRVIMNQLNEQKAQEILTFIQNVTIGQNVSLLRKEAEDGDGVKMDLSISPNKYYLPDDYDPTCSFLLRNADSKKMTEEGLNLFLHHTPYSTWCRKNEEENWQDAVFLLPTQTMQDILAEKAPKKIMLKFLRREKAS
jgi:hypothetical protein